MPQSRATDADVCNRIRNIPEEVHPRHRAECIECKYLFDQRLDYVATSVAGVRISDPYFGHICHQCYLWYVELIKREWQ